MRIILETERLLLREFEVADAEACYWLNADPQVVQYTGDPPFDSIEHARTFLQEYVNRPYPTFGRWVVIRKSDHAWLGWCGLKFHPEDHAIDLGYRFSAKYWNKGYATESSIGCLKHGFEVMQLEEIYAEAEDANPASIAVMQKCGMEFWKKSTDQGAPTTLYRMTSAMAKQSL